MYGFAAPRELVAHRAPLLVTGLLIAVLAGVTGLVVRHQVEDVYAESNAQLEAVGRVRVDQVLAWRAERSADARVVAASPLFATAVARWLERGDLGSARDVAQVLRQVRDAYEYDHVWLVRPSGELVATDDGSEGVVDPALRALVADAASIGAPRFGESVDPRDDAHLHLDVAVAVPSATGRPAAVLVLRADPITTLFPRLGTPSAADESRQVMLVRRIDDRVLVVTPGSPARATRVTDLDAGDQPAVAVRAALDQNGRLEGVDASGEPVLAHARAVTGTGWSVVVSVPAASVLARAAERAGAIILLALLLVGAIVAAGVVAWAARRREYVRRLRAAEERRLAVERNFSRVFALARDAFMLLDPDGRITEANEAAARMYGYAQAEMLDLDARLLEAPSSSDQGVADHAPSWSAAGTEDGTDGATYEVVHRHRDGTEFPAEVSTRTLVIDGRRYRQLIVRDITERRRHEAAQAGQLDELRRWHAAALGREDRILDLKREVNDLLETVGRQPRYASVAGPGAEAAVGGRAVPRHG